MGLDIHAYKKITKIDTVFDSYGDPIDPITRAPIENGTQLHVNGDFPKRAKSIESGAVYLFEDDFHFRAGSYGGYNVWRDNLARIAGWPLGSYEKYNIKFDSHAASAWGAESGPFWELICFSDCEGCIDAEISGKLAKDFGAFHEKAKMYGDQFFLATFENFKKAFETASKCGAVKFS
jgi:hypothetical protein